MTWLEHCESAEEFLRAAATANNAGNAGAADLLLKFAQVHATLAQVMK